MFAYYSKTDGNESEQEDTIWKQEMYTAICAYLQKSRTRIDS